MDSLTQFVLGASIAEATVGARVGRRAALIGGIVATLPDLDVLVPFADPVSNFTYHRSASHSLFVLLLLAPLLAWLVNRVQVPQMRDYKAWWLCCTLALVTHPLLDAFTVYGTQLAWPLSEYPFGLGSMFIIDPLYTVTLIVAVIASQLARHRTPRWHGVALLVSSLYLGLSVAIQAHVSDIVKTAVAERELPATQVGVYCTPFNIVAWRALVVSPQGYYVGYYSLLAPGPLRFELHPSEPELLADVAEVWPVQRLRWFTKGFNVVSEREGQVILSDVRMGLEPNHYVFSFALGQRLNGTTELIPAARVAPASYQQSDWRALAERIVGPNVLR